MASQSKGLILIADDFADARELYGECLRMFGYRSEDARDGAEAFDKAVALQPDVVVMDLSMPTVDGWEASRRLKDDPRTARIPIVALTGHSQASHVDRAKEAGCDVVIIKPFLPTALVQLIEKIMAGRATEPGP